jgi:hypothetical protein
MSKPLWKVFADEDSKPKRIAKENRTKKPLGWKIRVGQFLGHGRFVAHFTMPDGFYFTNDLNQCHIKKGGTARDLAVERAWEITDQCKALNLK